MAVPVGRALGTIILNNPLTVLLLCSGVVVLLVGLWLFLQHRKEVKKIDSDARIRSEAFEFTTQTLNTVLKTMSKQGSSRKSAPRRDKKSGKE